MRLTFVSLLTVAALKLLIRLPSDRIVALGSPWLPLYAAVRRPVGRRLKSLRGRAPFDAPAPPDYYRMRLRLAAWSLRHFGGGDPDLPIRIEGEEHYRAALAMGRPVALLGWHQGPVELLHRVPPPPGGRPFFVLTAGAFAPRLSRFMRSGREQAGKKIVPPGEISTALRTWVRNRGVLAVMVDQVPGKSVERLALWSAVEIPVPIKLLEWMRARGAVMIPVSVRWEPENGNFLFRYHRPLSPDAVTVSQALVPVLESALGEAPLQYNWSYPKIRVSSLR